MNTYIAPSDLSLKSCLDHAWHNFNEVSEKFFLTPSVSDHCPIAVVFRKFIPKRMKRVVFRDYSSSNRETFLSNIDREFSTFNPPLNNVNQYADYLINFLKVMQNKFFPVRDKLLSEKRYRSPWITSDNLRCIRKKNMCGISYWREIALLSRVTKRIVRH